jgi:hypothetical protein
MDTELARAAALRVGLAEMEKFRVKRSSADVECAGQVKGKPRQESIQCAAQRRTASECLNTRLVEIRSRGGQRP